MLLVLETLSNLSSFRPDGPSPSMLPHKLAAASTLMQEHPDSRPGSCHALELCCCACTPCLLLPAVQELHCPIGAQRLKELPGSRLCACVWRQSHCGRCTASNEEFVEIGLEVSSEQALPG